MQRRISTSVAVAVLLAACGGGGGGGATPTPPAPVLVSVQGPILAAAGGGFSIVGTDFPGPTGTVVAVRFEVSDGKPFGGCGSSTVATTGTVADSTLISGTAPAFVMTRDATAFVEVDFGPATVRSTTPIADFLGIADPALDQDGNGIEDPCDSTTYDFESDALGDRPAGTASLDATPALLTVRNASGDHAAAYAATNAVPYDALDRLRADAPQQDVDVYLDLETAAGDFNVELWSDGSFVGAAGSGLIFQVQSSGLTFFYERLWNSILIQRAGPALPASGRVRLRLRKLDGVASEVRLDLWNGTGWQTDVALWPVVDDRQYRGLDVALCNYWFGGATRGVKRVTAVHEIPPELLTIARSWATSTDRALFQRDASDVATIPVRVLCRPPAAGRLEARVVRSATGETLSGHDWADHATTVAARPDGLRIDLALGGVPAGGNYDVQVRLVDGGAGGPVLAQQALRDVAVGDVWIAAGQSNMSGYSGSTFGADAPVPEVHLFGNDGRWKEAEEPVDSGTDQTDVVSYETPATSCLLAFGKELWAGTGVPVAVVPTSLGGTNLYSQWQRSAANPANRGTLYGSMIARARRAAGATPPRGLLWFQGESDAKGGRTRAQYLADLQALASSLRTDLAAPTLAFLCGQLGTFSGANLSLWLAVQEAQREMVATDARAGLVTAVDLPRADSIHFNVAGYGILGRRFATAARRLVFGHAVDPTDDLLSATSGAGGTTVLLSFETPISGGSADLFRVTDTIGPVTVAGLSIVGATVTLSLSRALGTSPVVSYGWSVDPAAAWLRDAAGAAVPCFDGVAVGP